MIPTGFFNAFAKKRYTFADSLTLLMPIDKIKKEVIL